MRFWMALDARLVGARNENGFVAPESLDYVLGRDHGITDPDSCRMAGDLLALIAIGRNEGAYADDDEDSTEPEPKA